MKRMIAFSVLVRLALFAPVPAQAEGIPKLQLSPRSADLGRVDAGAPIEHTFPIKNLGTGILTLEVAARSCACTVAHLGDTRVAPGAETLVRVGYDPHVRAKVVQESAFVVLATNDPKHPRIKLEVLAEIVPPIIVTPSSLEIVEDELGEPAISDLHVEIKGDAGCDGVRSIVTSSDVFHLEKTQETNDGSSVRLTYKVAADPHRIDATSDQEIVLRFDSALIPLVKVPIHAKLAPRVKATPPTALFGIVSAGATPSIKIELKSDGPVGTLEARCPDKDVHVEVLPQSDITWTLNITLSRHDAGKGTLRSKIEVKDGKGFVVLGIPIIAIYQ